MAMMVMMLMMMMVVVVVVVVVVVTTSCSSSRHDGRTWNCSFVSRDVRLVSRRAEDVAAFQERERIRWDVVYDEDYYAFHPKGLSLEF